MITYINSLRKQVLSYVSIYTELFMSTVKDKFMCSYPGESGKIFSN